MSEEIDPYEAFELWMRENGFADVAGCKPEEVDLVRLEAAVAAYSRAQCVERQAGMF